MMTTNSKFEMENNTGTKDNSFLEYRTCYPIMLSQLLRCEFYPLV